MKGIKPILTFFLIALLVLVPVSAITWTNAGGCWTATDGTDTIVMWNATGVSSYKIPTGVTTVRYLVVAGGGGGGSAIGGGGGAGGLLTATGYSVTAGNSYIVTVGNNGTGADAGYAAAGTNGKNSSFANTTAGDGINARGGAGGPKFQTAGNAGGSGSGGGGRQGSNAGSGTAGQGNNGGSGLLGTDGTGGGGGGGGAGGAGSTATGATPGAGDNGANGGAGTTSDITGETIYYAAGGGGGYDSGGTTGGTGGSSIGGNGATTTNAATAGTKNTGSGGGAGGYSAPYQGGAGGGTGIVIIRFTTPGGDTTPPASITNLANTTTCENVTFSWTNPTDADYSHLYNLWDNVAGMNLTNSTTTKAFNPATVGTHTFSTKTVDLSGNMNSTWVNMTVSISACPTPTPTPTPTTTTTTSVPSVTCTVPTSTPWCAHQDMFLWGAYTDISGKLAMRNYPELNNTKALTSASFTSSSGEVTVADWLTPAFSSTETTTVAPGLWIFRIYANSSSDAGKTTLKYRMYNRSSSGTITWLFYGNAFSEDINSLQLYETSYARRNFTTLFPGDRFGIQINASTDNAAARTVTVQVAGNTNASVVSASYFLCSSCGGAVSTTTPTGTPLPYINNPTTDTRFDPWGFVKNWWWVGVLILIGWILFRKD